MTIRMSTNIKAIIDTDIIVETTLIHVSSDEMRLHTSVCFLGPLARWNTPQLGFIFLKSCVFAALPPMDKNDKTKNLSICPSVLPQVISCKAESGCCVESAPLYSGAKSQNVVPDSRCMLLRDLASVQMRSNIVKYYYIYILYIMYITCRLANIIYICIIYYNMLYVYLKSKSMLLPCISPSFSK